MLPKFNFNKGAMHCLQAKPYKYTCYSCQAAVTCVLANTLFNVLGKDYFMLHKILCGFITVHSPFNFKWTIILFYGCLKDYRVFMCVVHMMLVMIVGCCVVNKHSLRTLNV